MTNRRAVSEVPATPQASSPEHTVAVPRTDAASQEVEAPQTPQSPLADYDDTEDTDTNELIERFHANEAVATFSPNCQVGILIRQTFSLMIS